VLCRGEEGPPAGLPGVPTKGNEPGAWEQAARGANDLDRRDQQTGGNERHQSQHNRPLHKHAR